MLEAAWRMHKLLRWRCAVLYMETRAKNVAQKNPGNVLVLIASVRVAQEGESLSRPLDGQGLLRAVGADRRAAARVEHHSLPAAYKKQPHRPVAVAGHGGGGKNPRPGRIGDGAVDDLTSYQIPAPTAEADNNARLLWTGYRRSRRRWSQSPLIVRTALLEDALQSRSRISPPTAD